MFGKDKTNQQIMELLSKINVLEKEKSELASQIDLYKTTTEQFKRTFDAQNKRLEESATLYKQIDKLKEDLESLSVENYNLNAVEVAQTEALKQINEQMTKLKQENDELLDKTGWTKTGEKNETVGFYGYGKYIKINKQHFKEAPASIEGNIVTFDDDAQYPLSLMLYLWGK